MESLQVTGGCYTMTGRFYFDTNQGKLMLTPQDAIEIATTLFDWAGQSYAPIEKIEILMEKGEL